ncbi:MAG: SUMF1/EgtB/PvdO family nonheme iron enzyme [Bacteroidales bacterium]|nr:SUMF1/EgtB/PvdO family nonheme iron enzyme [Bacteroidales bacterium]
MGIKKKAITICLAGFAVGLVVTSVLFSIYVKSSGNDSCTSCHYHPDADRSYMLSMHYNSESGVKTDCAACHLPPQGTAKRFFVKVRTGGKDLMSYIFKDKEDIDFERKKELEYATGIVFNESCMECHVNLFPEGISDEAIKAHVYFEDNREALGLQCISCHLDAGHYNPNYTHGKMTGVPSSQTKGEVYDRPAEISGFADFTEHIPGTSVSVSMIAVPGGTFLMGSPEDEPFRRPDEGPRREVKLSPFFMGEVEVTWDQYWAFYSETMSEGRVAPEVVRTNNAKNTLDAISGPTPPFGAPDQGWGMGDRPAITMTWYAAKTFCQWLSLKTGKNYRLPTEAEWEYAARGGTDTPYFFEGNPKKFSGKGFLRGIFHPDTTLINGYAVYAVNSRNRSGVPSAVKANPFGLKNMCGNVMEYCSDWYAEDAYSEMPDGVSNPTGPENGTEHVGRGGLYSDDAADIRCAARSHTRNDAWLKTDPQNPKSIWWYSDVKGVGFRLVCDVPEQFNLKQP